MTRKRGTFPKGQPESVFHHEGKQVNTVDWELVERISHDMINVFFIMLSRKQI